MNHASQTTVQQEGFYWVHVTKECECDYVCGGWTVGLYCDGYWSLIGSSKQVSDSMVDKVGARLNYTLSPPSFEG